MTSVPVSGAHGGDGPRLAAALGLAPGDVLDLSASGWTGATLRNAFAHERILVRDCASFGLPRHVRIALPREHEHLRDALVTVTSQASRRGLTMPEDSRFREQTSDVLSTTASGGPLQSIVTLDLEGVLVPEIWIAVAEKTGIEALRRTTRDEPDYDVLMRGRLALLDQHSLKMSDIEAVIAEVKPLDGACEFLDALRETTQVLILSDTFEQFARPLMRQLGWPAVWCHRLVVENDRIVDYRLRTPDQKRKAVVALRELNYRVISAGDSYNDTTMLAAAHAGFLFHAPENVRREFPQFRALDEFGDLLRHITAELT